MSPPRTPELSCRCRPWRYLLVSPRDLIISVVSVLVSPRRWRPSNGETSSWFRSTTSGPGTATTTSSPTCSTPGCSPNVPNRCRTCIRGPAAGSPLRVRSRMRSVMRSPLTTSTVGRGAGSIQRGRDTKVGFDYVHSVVDDHSRLAYSELLPDEKGPTCAAFVNRALDHFAAHDIPRVERLMTDNAWAYRWSLRQVCAD